MMNHNLKYLYRAIYKDGTHYDQNVGDKSVANENKSCYYDLDVDAVRYFILSNGLISYCLDLTDGSVSINGSGKIYLSAEELNDFRLLYFRRVTINITNGVRSYSIDYVMGYTAKTGNGETVTASITIK
jgi:hypothetical protein